MSAIRWLHLSDFHSGKDGYSQISMFSEILAEVKEKNQEGFTPDLICITGDIANKGKKEEYDVFIDSFFFPLIDILGNGWRGKIYVVPGNHDVDMDVSELAQKHGALTKFPNLLDPDEMGLSKRQLLASRFDTFIDKAAISHISGNWIKSPEGSFTDIYLHEDGTEIGILGLNTAWLAEKDNDEKELSPGTNIVNNSLSKIGSTAVKIVLGHHPIDWFIPGDKSAIRSLLAKNDVIYLHGHLHENGTGFEEGAGRLFRSIRAGASYQVQPEDKILRNCILWCEFDHINSSISVLPLKWFRPDTEWKIDTEAFPNSYWVAEQGRYVLSNLTNKASTAKKTSMIGGTTVAAPQPPKGWEVVDKSYLKRKAELTPLNSEQVLLFFDGAIPTWNHALSKDIPRREIVSDLTHEFETVLGKGASRMVLLLGAGGEGKSTVLRQAACDLVETGHWRVLWHKDPDSILTIDYLNCLPQSEQQWIVVSDDADLFVNSLLSAVKAATEVGRKDVHFLLSARHTDWIAEHGNTIPWAKYTQFKSIPIGGLTPIDAEMIIVAWGKYGDKGLGKLIGLDIKKSVDQLLDAAKAESAIKEGAFLGAMLRVRYGEALKAHVLELLQKLETRPSPVGTLLDAFTHIVALHSENKLFLTKPVLAKALGCTPSALAKTIGALGYEAAVSPIGRYILTRHRAIAEAAKELIVSAFHVDFDEVYIDIVRSAWGCALTVSMYTAWTVMPIWRNISMTKGSTTLV